MYDTVHILYCSRIYTTPYIYCISICEYINGHMRQMHQYIYGNMWRMCLYVYFSIYSIMWQMCQYHLYGYQYMMRMYILGIIIYGVNI